MRLRTTQIGASEHIVIKLQNNPWSAIKPEESRRARPRAHTAGLFALIGWMEEFGSNVVLHYAHLLYVLVPFGIQSGKELSHNVVIGFCGLS